MEIFPKKPIPLQPSLNVDAPIQKTTLDGSPTVPVRKLNLLFPLSALLSFLFILTSLIVANPLSNEIRGPFVSLMQAHGMVILTLEVVAIVACGIGAMWTEARQTPPQPPDVHSLDPNPPPASAADTNTSDALAEDSVPLASSSNLQE